MQLRASHLPRWFPWTPVAVTTALALWTLLPGAGDRRTGEVVPPEAVGISSAGLARISSLLRGYVADGRILGAAFLVGRHSRIVLLDAVGYWDAETRTPVDPAAVLRIAPLVERLTADGRPTGTLAWKDAPYRTCFFSDAQEGLKGILLLQPGPGQEIQLAERFSQIAHEALLPPGADDDHVPAAGKTGVEEGSGPSGLKDHLPRFRFYLPGIPHLPLFGRADTRRESDRRAGPAALACLRLLACGPSPIPAAPSR